MKATRLHGPTLFALFSAGVTWSQPAPFDSQAVVDWCPWEAGLTDSARAALWQLLPPEAVALAASTARYHHYREAELGPKDLVHFVDFSGDGQRDAVLEGQIGESQIVLLYQRVEGRLIEVFRAYGALTVLEQPDAWRPASLRVHNYPCCEDTRTFIEDYVPVITDSTVRFELSSRVLLTGHTELPNDWLPVARRFRIKDPNTALRLTPTAVDNPRDGPGGVIIGNYIARYPHGTVGMVLSQVASNEGEWWFVVIKGTESHEWPHWDIHRGRNSEVPADLVGWMNSQHLDLLD